MLLAWQGDTVKIKNNGLWQIYYIRLNSYRFSWVRGRKEATRFDFGRSRRVALRALKGVLKEDKKWLP